MIKYTYLAGLVASIIMLIVTDYRYNLAFFYDNIRTAKTLVTAIIFFLIWDLMGVGLHIFYPGPSKFVLQINVLPGVPIEEIFFLFLLTYLSLIIWRAYDVLHTT